MMNQFEVYLEVDERGQCMAHVRSFPGCMVWAADRDSALAAVPDAIREYHQWLGRHGETVEPLEEPLETVVIETQTGTGPFDPGDTAALFEWERAPLAREEMERYFRVAGHNRKDLLALAGPISASVRRWRPHPEAMSVDDVLRHIGNSEQWYVSRLVAPEDLPPEWANDANMPWRLFLKMTRETGMESLRRLTDEELGLVSRPVHFTDDPAEEWTARKVMRRFLEHEREHTRHIQDILAQWRKQLLARLAAERAHLLWQYRGWDHETLAQPIAAHGWSAKDILVHVGLWDGILTQRMARILDGRIGEVEPIGDAEAMDAHNDEMRRRFQHLGAVEAMALAMKERGGFLAMLDRISDVDLHRRLRMPWGWRTRMSVWAKWRFRHDVAHANELSKFRQALPRQTLRRSGPGFLLRAILQATRKEFLTLADLISAYERGTRPVCGIWSLKDLIGHLTDWELVGVDGLSQHLAGQIPELDHLAGDIQAFNEAKSFARRDQPWDEIWAEFKSTRQSLLQLLEQATPADLDRSFQIPWGAPITGYRWMLIWAGHEREHAIDLRRSLNLQDLPRRFFHLE